MRNWKWGEMDGGYAMVFIEDNIDALKLKLLKQEAEIRFLKQENAELRFKLCRAERAADELQRQRQGGQLGKGEEEAHLGLQTDALGEANEPKRVLVRETTDKSQLRSSVPLNAADTVSCATEAEARVLRNAPELAGEMADPALGRREPRPAVEESPGRVSVSDSSSDHLRNESEGAEAAEGAGNEGEGECMERARTLPQSRPPRPSASCAGMAGQERQGGDQGTSLEALAGARVGGACTVVALQREMPAAKTLAPPRPSRGAPETMHVQGPSAVTGDTRSRVLSLLQAKCREISTKQQQQGSSRRSCGDENEMRASQTLGGAEVPSGGPGAGRGGAGQGIPLLRDPGRPGLWMGGPRANHPGGAAPLGAGLSLGLPLGHGEVLSQHRARLSAGGVAIGQRLPAVREEGDASAEDLSLKLPESPMMSSQSGGSASLAHSRHSSPAGMSPHGQAPGATGFPAGYQEALPDSLSDRSSPMPPAFWRGPSADQQIPAQDTAATDEAHDLHRGSAGGAEAENEDRAKSLPTCRLTLALTTLARDSIQQVKEEESESPRPSPTPPRDLAVTSGAVDDVPESEPPVPPLATPWGPLRGGMGRGAGLPRRPSGVPGKGPVSVQLPPIGQAQMTLDSLVSRPGFAAARSSSSLSSAAAAASAASKLLASLDSRRATAERGNATAAHSAATAPSPKSQGRAVVPERISDSQRPLSARLKELGSRRRGPEADSSAHLAYDPVAGAPKVFPAPAWPSTKAEEGQLLAFPDEDVKGDVAGPAGTDVHGASDDADSSQDILQPGGPGTDSDGDDTVAGAAGAGSHMKHEGTTQAVQGKAVKHDDASLKAQSGQRGEEKKGSVQNQELLALRLLSTCRAAGAGKGQGSVPVRRPVIGEPAVAASGVAHQHVIQKLMATRMQRLAARSGAHQELDSGLSQPSSAKDLGAYVAHGGGGRPSLVEKLRGVVKQDSQPAKRAAAGAACKSLAALDAVGTRALKRVKTEPDSDLVLSLARDP